MDAFILGMAGGASDLARPIAGASLLERQVEWLRANGARRIVVNRVVDSGDLASFGAVDADSTGVRVVIVPSAEPLDCAELARRVGARTGVVVVVGHATLGHLDLQTAASLAASTGSNVVMGTDLASVELVHLGVHPASRIRHDYVGWIRVVASERDAQLLTEDVLSGRTRGIEVRGSEIAPGIWRGRGATVAKGAHLVAPCYLGPDCVVASGARVGPGAILGRGAVVERHAIVTHARIDDGAIVGQGLAVSSAFASRGCLLRHDGLVIDVADPLLVGSAPSLSFAGRIAAAVTMAAVALPAAVLGGGSARAMRALARIAQGTGSWVGVTPVDDDEAVLIDVEQQLLPPDATEDMRDAARAYYRAKKSAALDAQLLLRRVLAHERAS